MRKNMTATSESEVGDAHEAGLVAAYVAGGRGRQLRAVMVPGNRVAVPAPQ